MNAQIRYLQVTHIPFARHRGGVELDALWLRDLEGLRDSMGRVTMTCIWLMGATPLSMPTTMRGKLVAGNTATGMVNAR